MLHNAHVLIISDLGVAVACPLQCPRAAVGQRLYWGDSPGLSSGTEQPRSHLLLGCGRDSESIPECGGGERAR